MVSESEQFGKLDLIDESVGTAIWLVRYGRWLDVGG